jgi:hypothetical protein
MDRKQNTGTADTTKAVKPSPKPEDIKTPPPPTRRPTTRGGR